MHIREINVVGYRSLRAIRFPVGALTVFVGANGVGKTNLYRALQLLQAAAAGTLARELASEGGMESALWAGKRTANKPARMKLSVGLGANQQFGFVDQLASQRGQAVKSVVTDADDANFF